MQATTSVLLKDCALSLSLKESLHLNFIEENLQSARLSDRRTLAHRLTPKAAETSRTCVLDRSAEKRGQCPRTVTGGRHLGGRGEETSLDIGGHCQRG